MMIPEFMRFYGYSATEAMNEKAITFFSLMNALYRIQATEILNDVIAVTIGFNGKDSSDLLESVKKQADGLEPILREVDTIKRIRK